MNQNIDIVIESRTRDLINDFKVRRILPSSKRRMVGPFIFLDEMGPEIIASGKGLDVAPHPHIGIATLTYLYKGELMHRDSLGTIQPVLPGEINWMTAGKGIAHSERTPMELRHKGGELFGFQSWIALPEKDEETNPGFSHHKSEEMPVIEAEGKTVHLLAGSLYGMTSPVRVFSDMFYADAHLNRDSKLQLPAFHEERAAFIVDGQVEFPPNNMSFRAGQLIIFRPGEEIIIKALTDSATLLLLGGEPIGKRHIWWNFVSSSRERIEQAKSEWREGKFSPVPGETEIIPLPEEPRTGVVRYP